MDESPLIESASFFIGKQGNGIVSFGSGQPDLPPPKEIYAILPDYKAFKYGLIQGQENLRQELAKQYAGADPDDFVVTNGASEALDLVFRALSDPSAKNNRVLLPRPYYYSYPYVIHFAGMEVVYTDLVDGRMDVADFREKAKGCKAALINSPSNPTGRVESVETLKEIERIAAGSGIYVISDEVYKDLIYERENYLLRGKRVITVNSFSKTFGMCGFRVGYLHSPDKEVVRKTIEMKVHTSMNTNILGQEMAYEALKVPRSYIDAQLAVWKERRDLIYRGLVGLGFDVWRPEGAFYVFPKIKNSGLVVSELYWQHKVITYDGAWFGDPHRIRLSYALDKEKIEEGLARIAEYLKGKEDWLL